VELRYAYENELMSAVSRGITLKAELQHPSAFPSFLDSRSPDPVRNLKNYCIIMNTLLRKAAEQGGVHPIHLDEMSSRYARKIEAFTSLADGRGMMDEMFLSYCHLVKKHSVRNYSSLIQQAIKESLYTDNDFYLLQGGKSTVINQTAASNFLISSDGSSVFFLDAPFVAYSSKNGSHAEAPVAEAPAAEIPAETLPGEEEEEEEGEALIPESQREYASLYRISITDGEAGEPELVDSEVSLRFTPHIGPDASRLTYAKNADEEDRCGELYVAGQLVSDDAYLNYRLFQEERFLFFTDWDTDDQCGTLCMIKLGDEKAEVIEIADDVHSIATTENGDVFYLQDYSEKRYEGTLFLYDMSKGKAKEIADDVTYLG